MGGNGKILRRRPSSTTCGEFASREAIRLAPSQISTLSATCDTRLAFFPEKLSTVSKSLPVPCGTLSSKASTSEKEATKSGKAFSWGVKQIKMLRKRMIRRESAAMARESGRICGDI